jgi:hypothetical protein
MSTGNRARTTARLMAGYGVEMKRVRWVRTPCTSEERRVSNPHGGEMGSGGPSRNRID